MGFLDKAPAKVGEVTKAAQEGIADQQAKRKADGLLRELGAWTYAKHKGGFDEADENIARVLGELAAHEAEHGELGAKEEPPPPPPPPAARRRPPPPPPPTRCRRRAAAARPGAAGPAGTARAARPGPARAAAAARARPPPPPPPPPGDPVPPPPPPGVATPMTRVGVFGAAGRMGSTVCEAVEGDPDLELVAAVDPLHAGIDLRRVADVDTHLQVAAALRGARRRRRRGRRRLHRRRRGPRRTSPSRPSTACTRWSAPPGFTDADFDAHPARLHQELLPRRRQLRHRRRAR